MEKLKGLYKDLLSRFKYLESQDAAEVYGNDLEGRRKENIQTMVAIGYLIIDNIYPTSNKSNDKLTIQLDFYVGDRVKLNIHEEERIKKELNEIVYISNIQIDKNGVLYFVTNDLNDYSFSQGFTSNQLISKGAF